MYDRLTYEQDREAYDIDNKRKKLFTKWKSLSYKIQNLGTIFQNPVNEYELTTTDILETWSSMVTECLNMLNVLIEESCDLLKRY